MKKIFIKVYWQIIFYLLSALSWASTRMVNYLEAGISKSSKILDSPPVNVPNLNERSTNTFLDENSSAASNKNSPASKNLGFKACTILI